MSESTVTVVMVSRGLWEMTKQALEGLIFTMSDPWDLVFINNGGDPETHEGFKEIAPSWSWNFFNGYQYHKYTRTVSLAAAWNRGYRMATGDYVMFANNDIVFYQYGWWDQLKDRLVGGLDIVGIQEMTWYKFRFVEGSLFALHGATAAALDEGAGRLFDNRFKLSCEDVDLSHRALEAGLKIGQVERLQPEYLVHIGHQTIQSLAGKEDLLPKMHASRTALCKKHGVTRMLDTDRIQVADSKAGLKKTLDKMPPMEQSFQEATAISVTSNAQ